MHRPAPFGRDGPGAQRPIDEPQFPDPLDVLIQRETCREILDCLLPSQRRVILLRLEGFDDVEIARRLGIHRSAVAMRFQRARQRICRELPHLAPQIAGRGPSPPSLEPAGPPEGPAGTRTVNPIPRKEIPC